MVIEMAKSKRMFFVILIVLIVALISLFTQNKSDSVSIDDVYKCSSDNECVSVQNGCCGCSTNGRNTAINKNYFSYWNSKMQDDCKEIACMEVISMDWTCFSEPKCINGECRLQPIRTNGTGVIRSCKFTMEKYCGKCYCLEIPESGCEIVDISEVGNGNLDRFVNRTVNYEVAKNTVVTQMCPRPLKLFRINY